MLALSCCWYHKGTNFQANHNTDAKEPSLPEVVADTTKVRIFKQITTLCTSLLWIKGCCWYHKGTNFQANHNLSCHVPIYSLLLLIPQRYEFSSKSQLIKVTFLTIIRCCWYHKGTNFQANHNATPNSNVSVDVVADTTKVRIFKQITTNKRNTPKAE